MSKKVASDIGHGQSNRRVGAFDPGAVDPKDPARGDNITTREYDINVKMAKEFDNELLSRKVSVLSLSGPLARRDDQANKANVNCGVSWHADSFAREGARGMTIYASGSAKSMRLAREIEAKIKPVLSTFGMPYRGIKTARFYILTHTKSPWILLEVGFISNQKDEIIVNMPKYQKELARAVADGVCDFLGVEGEPVTMPAKQYYVTWPSTNANYRKVNVAIWDELKRLGYPQYRLYKLANGNLQVIANETSLKHLKEASERTYKCYVTEKE